MLLQSISIDVRGGRRRAPRSASGPRAAARAGADGTRRSNAVHGPPIYLSRRHTAVWAMRCFVSIYRRVLLYVYREFAI